MSRARTILIGASHWHAPLLVERISARHDVVGISDVDPSGVNHFATLTDTPLYPTWRELLDAHGDAELAYVLVPHDTMREVCLELIDRDIPLVVEKPGGGSREDLAQILRAAEERELPVAVPLVQRGGPIDTWLAKAGDSIYESVQFIAGPPDRYLHNGSPWMVELERAGGGCMLNLAPHFVDLFLRSAGSVDVRTEAATSTTRHRGEVEDYASLTLTTGDGRMATIEVGYAFPDSPLKRHCSFMRIGSAGTATIWTDGSASFTSTAGSTETGRVDVDSDDLYGPFVDQVADGLSSGFPGLPGLRDLKESMEVIWDAYLSSQKERSGAYTQY